MSRQDLDALLDNMLDSQTWPWLVQSQQTDVEVSCADLEWQCDNAEVQATGHPQPQGFGVHRYILHAFSGRRRQGDFQFFLDAVAEAHPGIVLHTLSVDIVLDSCWGDISDVRVRQFWISAATNKWVVAFLGGPPCETWSRAREHQLHAHGRGGPRVIRTATQPWGLDSFSTERDSTDSGRQSADAFLYYHAHCPLHHWGMRCPGKHPARPPKETSASIWKTRL